MTTLVPSADYRKFLAEHAKRTPEQVAEHKAMEARVFAKLQKKHPNLKIIKG